MVKRLFFFDAAKKASMHDFFQDSEISDIAPQNVASARLNKIKSLAYQVQHSLIEGFNKTGGGGEKLDRLGRAFDERIANLDYGTLETVKESLSGTFLGLMIILGLSQKVHGENYWSEQKGWSDFEEWLSNMNQNIYSLDEEVKKFLATRAKA